MELFDKRFVYFMWDEELRGKECFCGDNFESLRSSVNENKLAFKNCLEPSTSADYPFVPILERRVRGSWSWRFAYYDPNYDCKVAYKEGKLIQNRKIGEEKWHEGAPIWQDGWEYRIKPADSTFYCGLSKDGEDEFTYDTTKEGYKHIYAEFNNYADATEWCKKHDKFAEVARAWENGAKIQFKNLGSDEWQDLVYPSWGTRYKYRVKPVVYYVGIGQMKALTQGTEATVYKHVYGSFDNPQDANDWIVTHKKFVPVMRAFEKGLTIEYKHRAGDWTEASTPSWDLRLRYRVKPMRTKLFTNEPYRHILSECKGEWEPQKRRMTNRELAKWLAEGKGQILEGLSKFVRTTYAYKDGDNTPCRKHVSIRAWNETEWHEPEVGKEVE